MEHLIEQLADIERQMDDATLSHSDQQLLDQAWDDIMEQIENHPDADEFMLDHIEEILARWRQEDEDDETLTDSETESIHTQPKNNRPGTPYADGPTQLVLVLTEEQLEEAARWRLRDSEGWVTEEAFEIADEF